MAKKLIINADEICEFPTFQNWVNYASSRLCDYGKKGEVILCIDTLGNTCHIGADMMKARDEGRFPVKAYLLKRSKDV